MSQTLFEKIVQRTVPADIVYETDEVIGFRDIDPKAPVHVLVVPKKPIPDLGHATAHDSGVLGSLLLAAQAIALQEGVSETGYRLIINKGDDAGMAVPHLHVHLLGGRSFQWPPG